MNYVLFSYTEKWERHGEIRSRSLVKCVPWFCGCVFNCARLVFLHIRVMSDGFVGLAGPSALKGHGKQRAAKVMAVKQGEAAKNARQGFGSLLLQVPVARTGLPYSTHKSV